ncbi:GNAT family N-acetyltransferase [Arthrobacter psychrochitiniphilus]|uniref:GNAT family N-acetyltransferase n=1 Tax=Arthrobacter psychrochitiniphilus TaxID=291045 RepID=UPI003F7CA840
MPETSATLQLTYESFDDVASPSVWVEVEAVFSSSFSASPYFEDPDELSQIVGWGPEQVAHVGGRLTIARCAGRVVGFALVHGLEGDDSWERTLASMTSSDSRIEGMVVCPRNVVVVHELAVDSDYRGQGIAKFCLAMALDNRLETDVVLGVYDQAKNARLMYNRWGFEDLGATYIQDGAVMLRVLAARLGELRLSN